MATTEKDSGVKLANKARNAAVREIIAENQDRYSQLLSKHRAALGLSADPEGAKKKAQVEKYHAKLAELGVNVSLDDMLAALDNS